MLGFQVAFRKLAGICFIVQPNLMHCACQTVNYLVELFNMTEKEIYVEGIEDDTINTRERRKEHCHIVF